MKPKRIKSFSLPKRFGNSLYKSCLAIIIAAGTLFAPSNISAQLIRKSSVSFLASDSLLVSADMYVSNKSNPYIILLHQERSCKGEFDSIAPRFIKMNYNCLAVDLRTGNNLGFLRNETADRARENGFSYSLIDALKDVNASVEYLTSSGVEEIDIFGSASSATLALIAGREYDNIKAIVAFSPGIYFSPEYELKDILNNYPKPVFIGCTAKEYEYLSVIEGFVSQDRIIFTPESGAGLRGTAALLSGNPTRDEYWLSLLIFFKSLQ